MERLEEGWGLIEPLVCTEPSQFDDEQDFTDLYTWVESYLEEQDD